MGFKVGDRVRVIAEVITHFPETLNLCDKTGEIIQIRNDSIHFPYRVMIDGHSYYFKESGLEPECCIDDLAELHAKSTPELKESLFKKFDNKKPRTDLLHPEFLLELAKVLGHGAEKYGDTNYKNCDDPNRYYAAALRHLFARKSGEILDPESGIDHLIHAATNLMFLFGLEENDLTKL